MMRTTSTFCGPSTLLDGCYADTDFGSRLNTDRVLRELQIGPKPLNKSTLRKYMLRGFRLWGGEKIKLAPVLMRDPQTGNWENTFSVSVVQRIKEARQVLKQIGEAGRHVDARGAWLSVEKAMTVLSEEEGRRTTRATLARWEKHCLLLGRGITATLEQNEFGNWVSWYLEKDVLAIKLARADSRNGVYRHNNKEYRIPEAIKKQTGRRHSTLLNMERDGWAEGQCFDRRHPGPGGPRVKAYRYPDEKPATFNGVYRRSDGAAALNVQAAAKQSDIPANTLYHYFDSCCYLPEGKLPHELMRRPGNGWEEKTILEADLNRLRAAIAAVRKKGDRCVPADGLVTAKELLEHFGLKEYSNYVKLGTFLARLADSGQLNRHKTYRLVGGRWYRPYGYHLEEFTALLGGRRLDDVLNELAQHLQLTGAVITFSNIDQDVVDKSNEGPQAMPSAESQGIHKLAQSIDPGHPVRVMNAAEIGELIASSLKACGIGSNGNELNPWDTRLTFDLASNCVVLDGHEFPDLNHTAILILQRLATARGSIVSSKTLCKEISECKSGEKTIRRALETLPNPLQDLINGIPGAGRSLQLPAIK